MGDGTRDDLYIDPDDDDGGSGSGDEEPDVDPDQIGVDDYTDSPPTDESPAEEEPSEDSGTPSTPTTPSGTGDSGGGGRGGGGGVIGIPEGGDVGGDSPDEPGEEAETDETEEPQETETPDEKPEENEAEDEDEDDDDEEEQEPKVVQYSDPWDNVGWGLYPIMLKIEERYGHEVGTDYQLVPVREFDDPDEMASKWERDSLRHKMSIDVSVWDENPPESTELANRAYLAAMQQGPNAAQRYLRRLRMATMVEGTNIEDKESLFELAKNAGLDIDRLEDAWDDVKPLQTKRDPSPPFTKFHVDGEEVTQPGYLHYDDIVDIFDQAGIDDEEPQPLSGFVTEHGPATTKEVMTVYEWSQERAEEELQQREEIVPIEIGVETFWARHKQANSGG